MRFQPPSPPFSSSLRAVDAMFRLGPLGVLLLLASQWCYVVSAVTVYGPLGAQGTPASSGAAPSATLGNADWTNKLNAYNNVRLQPPPLPSPLPPTAFSIAIPSQAQNMPGLSIPQRGDFWGFSIEMSVVQQVSE